MERHVLVVYPHPDDETFGSAGVILRHTEAGTPVTYVCGTLGQMGRNMGKPFFATREALKDIRKKELEDACEVLGIKDLRLLGLRDKTLEFEDPEWLADKILSIIEELNPSLVITHYPKHGVHPDHDALGAATVRAVAKMPKAGRPIVYGHAITRNRIEALGDPDITLDISDLTDKKFAAIRAHRSQSESMLSQMETSDDAIVKRMRDQFSKEFYWIYNFSD
jgi:N-acetylglucosamine malate deacetylase 2